MRQDPDALVAFLNSLVALDRDWMDALVKHRPECNLALARHPTVQVGRHGEGYHAGLIGLLNGIVGEEPTDGVFLPGQIAAVSDGNGRLEQFIRINPPAFSPK
nr:hypothetical protein GCM10017606_25280 [Microbacterium terregens]